ncbi:MAG: DnaA/Hda family protein, partial [Acidimicrobiia bacterium]
METSERRLTAAAHAWESATTALQAQLSEATWNTWFRDVRPIDLDGNQLRLAIPNAVICERIRSSYSGLITAVLQDVTGDDIGLELVVDAGPRVDEPVEYPRQNVRPVPQAPADHHRPVSAAPAVEPPAAWTALNPRYTFEHFVIGASNRFAHAAALAVAETPARSYNPLFIYGPAGLGKTHLLHAIGNYVMEVHQLSRVRYVSTETLMNEFVDAIRNNAA